MTVKELKAFTYNVDIDALDAVFVTALIRSIKTGEYKFIQECIDRILGKPKQTIEMPTTNSSSDLTAEEKIRYEAELANLTHPT
jgi:hypothetical protein